MRVQPVPLQVLPTHIPRTSNQSLTTLSTTLALKFLLHLPFRARIEERKRIAFLQWLVIHNSNFHLSHVEDEAWFARVVAVKKVRVELDVCVSTCLYRGVGFFAWCCGCDLCEEVAWLESCWGVGVRGAGKSARVVGDSDEAGVRGWFCSRLLRWGRKWLLDCDGHLECEWYGYVSIDG
ncbi:hypothetical protein BDW69DRAFT_176960 [Aspergillus filifer]